MGASISISPPLNMQTVNVKNFLDDKNNLRELFAQIVIYSRPHVRKNRHGMNDKIAIEEVLLYFTKDCSTFLTNNFVCNSLVLISAFEFALNKVRTMRSKISEKQFQRLMEAMFLFSHLWEMFLVSDDHVQDEILFVGEFKRAKYKLAKIKGFTFKSEVSDAEWAAAFADIDKSSDKEISFAEVCHYVTKRLISPKKYAALAISNPKEIKHTLSDRRGMRIFSTRSTNTKKVLGLMTELSFKVDGSTFAVSMASTPTSMQRHNTGGGMAMMRSSSKNMMSPLKDLITRMSDDEGDAAAIILEDHEEGKEEDDDEEEEEEMEAGTESPGSLLAHEENVASRQSLFKMIKQKKLALQQLPQSSMYVLPTSLPDSANVYANANGGGDDEDPETRAPDTLHSAMEFYTVANAARMAKDLLNTKKRLVAVRNNVFGSESIPDHAILTSQQQKAARLKELHTAASAKPTSPPHTSQRVKNKTNHKRNDFESKFPDKMKRNPHPYPSDYNANNNTGSKDHHDKNGGDLKYLFVTDPHQAHHNFNLEATSLMQSDVDSNYIYMDACNLSHYSAKSARLAKEWAAGGSMEEGGAGFPQQHSSSRSIRVQGDLGGSIHTNSASMHMQHLSFDRDTGRRPPSIVEGVNSDVIGGVQSDLLGGGRGDASIALSSVNNDDHGGEGEGDGGINDDFDMELETRSTSHVGALEEGEQKQEQEQGRDTSPDTSDLQQQHAAQQNAVQQNTSQQLSTHPITNAFESLDKYVTVRRKSLSDESGVPEQASPHDSRIVYSNPSHDQATGTGAGTSSSRTRIRGESAPAQSTAHILARDTNKDTDTDTERDTDQGAQKLTNYYYAATHHRPESAPACTTRIQLGLGLGLGLDVDTTPDAPPGGRERDMEELERKYYPPTHPLGYYIQHAKSSPSRSAGGFGPRRTYIVPPSQRRSGAAANALSGAIAPPPLCHSWMLEDPVPEQVAAGGHGHGNGHNRSPGRSPGRQQSGRKGAHSGSRDRVPMSAKKAQAIATIRRKKILGTNHQT